MYFNIEPGQIIRASRAQFLHRKVTVVVRKIIMEKAGRYIVDLTHREIIRASDLGSRVRRGRRGGRSQGERPRNSLGEGRD